MLAWLMPLGTWGEWVSGIATTLALLVALRVNRRESSAELELRHTEIEEEADLLLDFVPGVLRLDKGVNCVDFTVRNNSRRSIYMLWIELDDAPTRQNQRFVSEIGPRAAVTVTFDFPGDELPMAPLASYRWVDWRYAFMHRRTNGQIVASGPRVRLPRSSFRKWLNEETTKNVDMYGWQEPKA